MVLCSKVKYLSTCWLLICCWPSNSQQQSAAQPEVTILQGTVKGITLTTRQNRSVSAFLAIPYAQPPIGDLRYITQSGSALTTWGFQPRATCARRALQLGEYVGCTNDTSASLISCLRGVNVSDIVASYPQFNVWGSLPSTVWSPTDEPDRDGAIHTDSPKNIFAAGGARDLPGIIGIVRDEGSSFTSSYYEDEDLFADFLNKFDTLVPELLTLTHQSDSGAAWTEAIKSYYFNNDLTTNTSQLLTNLTILVSDAIFFYPAYNALQQQLSVAASPQYFYTFNYKGSWSFDSQSTWVGHKDILIYLLPSRSVFSSSNTTRSASDFRMVDTIVELWTSFATNGTPTTTVNNNTVSWEPYSLEDNYLRIGNDSDLDLEVQYSFMREKMKFWAILDLDSTTDTTSGSITPNPYYLSAFLLLTFSSILRALTLVDT